MADSSPAALDPVLALLQNQAISSTLLAALRHGRYNDILASEQAQHVLHHKRLFMVNASQWANRITEIIRDILGSERLEPTTSADLISVGLSCLSAFLQANVTGPPLQWSPAEACLPSESQEKDVLFHFRASLISGLTVDGESVYHNILYPELLCLAKVICNHAGLLGANITHRWARLRVNSWHQRLLSEVTPSLQRLIQEDLDFLSLSLLPSPDYAVETKAHLLLERAAIYLNLGEDKNARDDLDAACKMTGFKYVLTGRLGKRTKFQTFDTSQLVVLAKSISNESPATMSLQADTTNNETKPETVDLDDDTLLDRISFIKDNPTSDPKIEESIPAELQDIDPANQPVLRPLDAIILLSLASSITNTSPSNGLTREETLPYANRVLGDGSNNWQIYSQALLVRSRIEGYKARTVERGVLQMQALVDQVIAQTSPGVGSSTGTDADERLTTTTFFPRPKSSESAGVSERLKYIHALASPTRWTLEAELAEQWIKIGGLRTALEIYERLEMWAEAALCWASLGDENKARNIICQRLYTDVVQKTEKSSLPNDAPRLFCILGDIDSDPSMYERAWSVSNSRYSRAQRSLGKHYLNSRDLPKSEEAYTKSLNINPQNTQAWFALGCVRLELRNWHGAIEAFSNVVQREPDDAEAWSNLAASLLRLPVQDSSPTENGDVDIGGVGKPKDLQKHARQAFTAFKRAAALKHDSYRIWQNVLNVGATLSQPPYADIVVAQQRLIELRGSTEGEGCVDVEVMEGLLSHVIQYSHEDNQAVGDANTTRNGVGINEEASKQRKRFGLEHMFVELVQKHIMPLITHSRRLWQLVAKLAIHLMKPTSALDAYEKAWRVTLNRPGWDSDSGLMGASGKNDEEEEPAEKVWQAVVDATIELVDAYESLGEMEVTEGLAAGTGELVCKNWRYKARMAIRSVIGRRTKAGLEGMEQLQKRMDMLKTS